MSGDFHNWSEKSQTVNLMEVSNLWHVAAESPGHCQEGMLSLQPLDVLPLSETFLPHIQIQAALNICLTHEQLLKSAS